ncbi:phosphopentomutase [Candidatus Allofournierella excrementavium]|uniref:phosphopentomutase n=1 Tax=Candidatus Allofournierella excrementavium TaxID=2838591 RepID=UPI003AF93369
MTKRVFLIVLDSFGIGYEPDADKFGDVGANTLASIAKDPGFAAPNMASLGLFNLDGVQCGAPVHPVAGSCVRLQEASNGKDTTIGHWEIAGVESERALPTYPDGFPPEVIEQYEKLTGRKVLCNKPYSGTEVLKDYGEEHMRTGALIVYTSADSVFQVAAHEEVVPLEQLYEYCQMARDMLKGEHGVGRVIARPFVGSCAADFKRTSNRHDYSLKPPAKTMLDYLKAAGKDVIGVGKIYDIFDGEGLTEKIRTSGNTDGIRVMLELADRDFEGLAFINLVDFDMIYGHRRNIPGYAAAASEFDRGLGALLKKLRPGDVVMITGDHGCDPGFTKTTDHTREYVPLLVAGPEVKKDNNLGTVLGFGAIGRTICTALGVDAKLDGQDLAAKIFN